MADRSDIILRDGDKDVLKALSGKQNLFEQTPESIMRQQEHTIISDKSKKSIETIEQEMAQQNPGLSTSSTIAPGSSIGPGLKSQLPSKTENLVLSSLKRKFGLEKIKAKNTILSGMNFSMKAINSEQLIWADTNALVASMIGNGNYNPLEYQSKLKKYIAAAATVSIDGISLQEVFEVSTHKESWEEFVRFLLTDSTDNLAAKLVEFYDEEIEPLVKIEAMDENSPNAAYICTKCQTIVPHEKSDRHYYCHLDGAPMQLYKLENDLPLV